MPTISISSSCSPTRREAFIFVVAGTRETSAEIAKLERIRGGWETYFSDSTDGRGTMIARLR